MRKTVGAVRGRTTGEEDVNDGGHGFYGLLRRCFEHARDEPFLLLPVDEATTDTGKTTGCDKAAGCGETVGGETATHYKTATHYEAGTGCETVTYGEMDSRAERASAWLAERGVSAGDRVMAQLPKSPDAVAAYLGVLRLGAVFVPVNPAYTTAEVGYFSQDCSPAAVLRDGDQLAEALNEPWPRRPPPARLRPDDAAAIVYTSGTTGRPKGAVLTHGNLAHNAVALHSAWGFECGDVLLHILPIFHVHGLMVALHTAMVGGSAVIFLPRFTPRAAAEALPGATVMMGVPTHYTRLLGEAGFNAEACRGIRLLVSGSAPMTAALHRAVAERTGHDVLERYGLSETLMITSNPYEGRRVAGTVGFALPGTEIRVRSAVQAEGGAGVAESGAGVAESGAGVAEGGAGVTERGSVQAEGGAGVVEVRGPGVGPGYWNRPDATRRSRTADGWFVTGDVGRLNAEGRLTLEGRLSDMIITGGQNVYPAEIEQALDAHPAVAESAVVGLEHPDWGEAVTAFAVLADPAAPFTAPAGALAESSGPNAEASGRDFAGLDTADFASALAGLARFKHPKRVVVADELPRNAMGKVLKAELRARYADLFSPP